MTDIEEPKATWSGIVTDSAEGIAKWIGAKGYAGLALLAVLAALHVYTTGDAGPLIAPLIGAEAWLFALGVAVGGNLTVAICLYGEDGDTE